MKYSPLARIIVRYGVGLIFGASAADAILGDPDLMNYIGMGASVAVSYLTERAYRWAVKQGWTS